MRIWVPLWTPEWSRQSRDSSSFPLHTEGRTSDNCTYAERGPSWKMVEHLNLHLADWKNLIKQDKLKMLNGFCCWWWFLPLLLLWQNLWQEATQVLFWLTVWRYSPAKQSRGDMGARWMVTWHLPSGSREMSAGSLQRTVLSTFRISLLCPVKLF